MRAALVSVPSWHIQLSQLQHAVLEFGSMTWRFSPSLAPPFWKYPAIVYTLSQAAAGFPQEPRLARA
eukprot:8087739-Pyramimonas_sp.AAC.1